MQYTVIMYSYPNCICVVTFSLCLSLLSPYFPQSLVTAILLSASTRPHTSNIMQDYAVLLSLASFSYITVFICFLLL